MSGSSQAKDKAGTLVIALGALAVLVAIVAVLAVPVTADFHRLYLAPKAGIQFLPGNPAVVEASGLDSRMRGNDDGW